VNFEWIARSEKYDRDMEDIFDIQDEISLAIVDKLKIKLLRRETDDLFRRSFDEICVRRKGGYTENRTHLALILSFLPPPFFVQSFGRFAGALFSERPSIHMSGFSSIDAFPVVNIVTFPHFRT
jgi:hypothetical protein